MTTEIADQYQTVLRTVILLGYDDELPVDVELPEELMPIEYISLFTD